MVKKMKKSSHLFSERQPGTGRSLVFLGIVFLSIFTLCSVYTLILTPTNPIAWSMTAFFAIALCILLFSEDNVLPKLEKKKSPHAAVAWFFSWVFIAFLVSFIVSMNAAHLAMAILFGFVTIVLFSYVLLPDARWVAAKQTVKNNTAGRVSKRLNLKKRKKNKNKKRRIFRY